MRATVVYGAGGHAGELIFQLRAEGVAIAAIVDDRHDEPTFAGVTVHRFESALRQFPTGRWHVAIGNIEARGRVIARLREHGLERAGFVSNRALIATTATLAPTVQVFAGAVVSDRCRIGDHAIVHFGSIICHDVKIGGCGFVGPRVAISGNVDIGEGVWVGVGAAISHGTPDRPLRIGDRAVIGAGACVIADVEPGTTVVGVPARPLPRRDA